MEKSKVCIRDDGLSINACLSTVYMIHLLVFLVKRVGGAPRGVRNKHIGKISMYYNS